LGKITPYITEGGKVVISGHDQVVITMKIKNHNDDWSGLIDVIEFLSETYGESFRETWMNNIGKILFFEKQHKVKFIIDPDTDIITCKQLSEVDQKRKR
jgi:hypothetical protein